MKQFFFNFHVHKYKCSWDFSVRFFTKIDSSVWTCSVRSNLCNKMCWLCVNRSIIFSSIFSTNRSARKGNGSRLRKSRNSFINATKRNHTYRLWTAVKTVENTAQWLLVGIIVFSVCVCMSEAAKDGVASDAVFHTEVELSSRMYIGYIPFTTVSKRRSSRPPWPCFSCILSTTFPCWRMSRNDELALVFRLGPVRIRFTV